jgi:poly-beta-1,6-N-acetyl-D-glucosamine synthase
MQEQQPIAPGNDVVNQSADSLRSTRYIIVTAARDEEAHIAATIEAVVRQTILPSRWIIVDDGSSDRTGSIVDTYTQAYSWISVLHRPNRGGRKNGAGVVEAFDDGYAQIKSIPCDFIVKLDADLTFEPNYFENAFYEFSRDPSLGIAGGTLYHKTHRGLQLESHPRFHVRGATKIYRKACWDEIGGLWRGAGWDTIDEVKANMFGWSTRTFSGIHALHHRLTGTAEGLWKDNVKNGRGSYAAGYHPLYVLARSIKRLHLKPYLLGSLGMLYGFITASCEGMPRIGDPQVIRYIRKQQLNRLLGRPTVWS